jgi:hypothetical protein
MREYSSKANWLSFVLHFIFGLFVGCLGGLVLISRRRHGIWLNHELILPYLIGAALVGAGLGARLGDRLWIGLNYLVIPPDAPIHSKWSYYLSLFVTSLGAIIVALSLFRHFAP